MGKKASASSQNGHPATRREAASRWRSIEGARPFPADWDPLIHDRVRLGILSALAVNPCLSFRALRELLGTTDGNLSVHARKLEDSGYVRCEKTFQERVPRSEYRITAKGGTALRSYLDHMEALIRAVQVGGGKGRSKAPSAEE